VDAELGPTDADDAEDDQERAEDRGDEAVQLANEVAT
jgi:hypothetical protein